MEYKGEEPKRVFEKTFPVKVGKTMNYDEVRQAALKKWEDYDRKFSRDRGMFWYIQMVNWPILFQAVQKRLGCVNIKI